MAWARQLPSGKWQGLYRKVGQGRKGFSAGTFKTEKQAVRAAEKIEGGLATDPSLAKITVSEFAYEHVLDIDSYEAATTHQKDLARFRNQIEPYFGSQPLGQIRPLDIRQWVTVLKSHHAKLDGKPLAPATVVSAFWLFSKIMDLAVEGEFIISTPFVRSLQKALPSIPRPKPIPVTVDDVHRIAESIAPRFSAAVLTIGMLGLRFGEMAGLRYQDLHLDELRPRIEVVGAMIEVGGVVQWQANRKNGEGYSLPLPVPLQVALKEHVASYADHDTYVFSGAQGKVLRRNWNARHFKLAAIAAGLPPTSSPHKMRHACVSVLVDLGVHPKVIADWIGDSTVRMVMERYANSSSDALDDVAVKLSQVYGQAGGVQPNVQPRLRIVDQER